MKSYLGLGGFIGRIVNFWIRDIHPSQYGCICPIDTPKGINIGLIGSLAIHVRIGHWGFLESPFYESFEEGKKKPTSGGSIFGYEISILVNMDVFAQLTHLKESILDLLDP